MTAASDAPTVLRQLAYDALAAAAEDDADKLADAGEAINDQWGKRGLFTMLWAWSTITTKLIRTTDPDDSKPGPYTFDVQGANGEPVSPDDVPPAERFVARWLTVAANDDIETACHLWMAIVDHEDSAAAVVTLARITAQSAVLLAEHMS